MLKTRTGIFQCIKHTFNTTAILSGGWIQRILLSRPIQVLLGEAEVGAFALQCERPVLTTRNNRESHTGQAIALISHWPAGWPEIKGRGTCTTTRGGAMPTNYRSADSMTSGDTRHRNPRSRLTRRPFRVPCSSARGSDAVRWAGLSGCRAGSVGAVTGGRGGQLC